MTRTVIGSLAGIFVATALVAAQSAPPSQTPPAQTTPTSQAPTTQTPPRQTPPPATTPSSQDKDEKDLDVTLTGCIIQGSGPTVFVLDNAKNASQSAAEKGKTYVLASSGEDVDFVKNINHKVTVSGSAETKTAPMPQPGQKVNENDLPKLKAKTVVSIADSCTADAR